VRSTGPTGRRNPATNKHASFSRRLPTSLHSLVYENARSAFAGRGNGTASLAASAPAYPAHLRFARLKVLLKHTTSAGERLRIFITCETSRRRTEEEEASLPCGKKKMSSILISILAGRIRREEHTGSSQSARTGEDDTVVGPQERVEQVPQAHRTETDIRG